MKLRHEQIVAILLLSMALACGETDGKEASEERTARPAHEFTFVRLKYNSRWEGKLGPDDKWGWNYHPTLFPTMVDPFKTRTLIDVADQEVVLTPDSEELFKYPLVYMEGMRPFELNDEEAQNLRRYIYRGGVLFIDDSGPWRVTDKQFEGSIMPQVRRILPTEPLRVLPPDHAVFRCFYTLPGVPLLPHIGMTHPHSPLEVIEVKGRIGVIISYNDMGGAARFIPEPRVRGAYTKGAQEFAWRCFINITVYTMTH